MCMCVCGQVLRPDFRSCKVAAKSILTMSNLYLANPTPKMRCAHGNALALQQALSISQHPVSEYFWEQQLSLGSSLSFLLI